MSAPIEITTTRPGTACALRKLAEQGATTDAATAARFLGIGRNGAYDAIKRGEWPTRVLRIGKKIRIPVADLAAVLGIDLEPEEGDDAPRVVEVNV